MPKLWYVILALVAIIVLLLLFWPGPPPPDRSKEIVFKHKIDSLTAEILALKADHKTDSLETVKKLEASDAKIKRLQARRPEILKEIDTVLLQDPAFNRYVQVTDSVIIELDHKVNFLEDALGKEQRRFTQMEVNFQESMKTFQQQHEGDREEIASLMNTNKKLRLRNKILKAIAIVGAVGGIYLGSRLE